MTQHPSGRQSGVGKLVENWRDLYARHLYQLAQFEIETAAAQEPNDAGLRFLVGITELARHRGEAAKAAFDAVEVLQRNGGAGSALSSDLADGLPEVMRKLKALGGKSMTLAAPPDPVAWLRDPGTIGQRIINRVTIQPTQAIEFRSGSLIDDVRIMDAPVIKQQSEAAAPTLSRPQAQPVTAQSARGAQALTSEGTSVSGEWSNWERDLHNLLARNDAKSGLAMVDRALTQNPDNVWLAEWRAKVLARAGRTRDAVNQYVATIGMAQKAGMNAVVERLGHDALHQGRDHREGLLALSQALNQADMAELSGAAARQAVEVTRRSGSKEVLIATMQRAAVLVQDPTQFEHELARLRGEARSVVASTARALAEKNASGPAAPPGLKAQRGNLPPELRASTKVALNQPKPKPGQVFIVSLIFMLFALFISCGAGLGVIPLLLLFILNGILKQPGLSKAETDFGSFARLVLIFAAVIGLIAKPWPW